MTFKKMIFQECKICYNEVKSYLHKEVNGYYPITCEDHRGKYHAKKRFFPHKDNPSYIIDILL